MIKRYALTLITALAALLIPVQASAIWLTPAGTTNESFGPNLRSEPAVPLADDPLTGPLRVVTRVVEPFVIDADRDPSGLCARTGNGPAILLDGEDKRKFCGYSQELLKAIADRMGRTVAPQSLETTADDLIASMRGDNPYDIGVGNLSITSDREKIADFSTPIPVLNSGIQIMTPAPEAKQTDVLYNAWSALTNTGARQFYPVIGLIFLLMVGTAALVYVLERRKANSFLAGNSWVKGIAEAFWWLLTTIFGQEEAHPRRLISRIIAFMWIPFGVICVSLFTATVTASLTAQQIQNTIQGLDDLRTKRVLTVAGSTSKLYLDDNKVSIAKVVPNIKDAYPLLEKGDYDAIVYDAPTLQYYADTKGKGKVVTVGKLLKRESYGLVFPSGSPLRERVNQTLLTLQDEGVIDQLNHKWFEVLPN